MSGSSPTLPGHDDNASVDGERPPTRYQPLRMTVSSPSDVGGGLGVESRWARPHDKSPELNYVAPPSMRWRPNSRWSGAFDRYASTVNDDAPVAAGRDLPRLKSPHSANMTGKRRAEGSAGTAARRSGVWCCSCRTYCPIQSACAGHAYTMDRRGSGAVAQVSVRTERALDNAPPLAGRPKPNGAYSGTSGDTLRGHVSRHHTVA